MFNSWNGFTYFKYVPGAFRALGAHHRRNLEPAAYSGLMFFGPSGANYEAALNRALAGIGGVAGLRY